MHVFVSSVSEIKLYIYVRGRKEIIRTESLICVITWSLLQCFSTGDGFGGKVNKFAM